MNSNPIELGFTKGGVIAELDELILLQTQPLKHLYKRIRVANAADNIELGVKHRIDLNWLLIPARIMASMLHEP